MSQDQLEKPTAMLMRCLEDFGESEATVAIVVFRQQNGDLNWRASNGSNTSEIVGMLEVTKQGIIDTWLKHNA
jgi:hypothetical protein